MKINLTKLFIGILFLNFSCHSNSQIEKQPNIVIIYADDMGYGDLNCQNPNSKIPTPNLDQLAREGMRFTDAHSSSGICSPSRFSLLTGMHHWRRQHSIVQSFGKPFFKDSDVTLPRLLKTKNYTTACIGKWHLGWNWELKNAPTGAVLQWGKMRKFYKPSDIELNKPIKGGPLDRGFDYYFGDGTINFPPYAWIENEEFIETPNEIMDIYNIGVDIKEGNWEFRAGPKVKNWNPYKVLPTLADKTVEWIGKQNKEQPFFLYFALPSPHAPIIPNDEFDGKSEAGAYGDFMYQTDWVVGQVLKALKQNGLEENTIIIFSADNGPEKYAFERAETFNHFSMGDFRGLKRDVWEGGHHVPFIVKWPEKIKANSVSDALISQTDIIATLANITNIELPKNAAPDSFDQTALLMEKEGSLPIRDIMVHNTFAHIWGMRQGDWLYINNKTGQHSKMPESYKTLRDYKDFNTEGLLFNIKEDPEQRVNLYEKYPNKVVTLKDLLEQCRTDGFTVNRH